MESSKRISEVPELTNTDLDWLQETIGVKCLRETNKWKSIDYKRMIERHLAKTPATGEYRLNTKNRFGNTPLHLIAISENYAAICGLLMCGADVNIVNHHGQTPITYSQHCPDYTVGFQFFRHLHKLNYLGQYISDENIKWYDNAREIYLRNYPHDGYLMAFTNDPNVKEEMICRVRSKGEEAIHQAYNEELQKIPRTRLNKNLNLNEIVDLKDQQDVSERYLRELKNFTKRLHCHVCFPHFGFMFHRKYRQSLENLQRERKIGYEDSCDNDDGIRMRRFSINEFRDEERVGDERTDDSNNQRQISDSSNVLSCEEKVEKMRLRILKLTLRKI